MGIGRGFRRLWAGRAAGNLSDGIIFVAVALLATSLTVDAILIAGLAAVYCAVRLLVVVPVGVLVDRLDRRTILWTSNLSRAALLLLLAALFAVGAGSLPLLYVVFACLGMIETAADNAALSILPAIVPVAQLDRANGRVSAAQLVADEFVGPPLGGILFAVAVAMPAVMAGGFYAAAALFFLALPRGNGRLPDDSDLSRRSIFCEALQGARWLHGHGLLGRLAVVGGLASMAYMMPFSLLVLYSQEVLALDSAGYGVILAVSALGGLLGSFITAPVRLRADYRWTIVGSLLLGAASMVFLSVTRSPYLAALFLAAYVLHAVVWGICVSSLRQRLVPDVLRGRVNASSQVLALLGLTLGAALGGLLASVFILSAPFLASGIVFTGCAVVAWWLLRRDPLVV